MNDDNMNENQDNTNSEDEDELKVKISIFWIGVSIGIAILLAKFAKGSMCSYMFMSMAWLYLWVILTQRFQQFESHPKEHAYRSVASLTGWLIGTVLVWRNKKYRLLFFEE